MFPTHCSEVCLVRVSFPLTEENILHKSIGKTVSHNTGYMALSNGSEWAVIKIQESKKLRGFFKIISRIEIVSLPKDTVFVNDPGVDVNNVSLMASIAEKEKKGTVVVIGKFSHLSFISNETPVPLLVFDFAPPTPPKLVELVKIALGSGRVNKPIKVIPKVLDLNELARKSDKSYVMFPCDVSGYSCGKKVLHLARESDVSSIGVDNIALIGCDVSLKIFKLIYGKKPEFINMCPLYRAEVVRQKGVKCIARCCKLVGKSYLRMGDTVHVSYDPSLEEVEEAILDLFGLRRGKSSPYGLSPAIEAVFRVFAVMLRHIVRT